MKYIAIFNDEELSRFRLDDNGLTLVLTDKYDTKFAVPLTPVISPTLVTESRETCYLSQGHIDAMLDYELEESVVKLIKRINGYEDI